MARLRTIKPGFFTNDDLGECQPLARILFAGLWCQADRAGRLEDRPKRLKVEVLPYDDCDIEALLGELIAHGFVVRYEAGGVRYMAIPTWHRHQNPHIKEAESTIPAPPSTGQNGASLPISSAEHHAGTVQAPDEHSSSRAVVVLGSCLDSCLDSGLGSGGGVAPDADAPDAPRLEPVTALVVTPSETGRAVRVSEPTGPPREAAGHRALWDAFTGVFGEARGTTERQRRGEACKRMADARASPDEIRLAASHWGNVMGDATMTELGITANLGKLLTGPQIGGRSNGTVVGHKQQVTEYAAINRGPKRGADAADEVDVSGYFKR